MSNVKPLHSGINPPAEKPNADLVSALKELVDMAESGMLQSYIGTGFTKDGLWVSTWSDYHDDVYQMLGSIEWIKSEYIHRHTKEPF